MQENRCQNNYPTALMSPDAFLNDDQQSCQGGHDYRMDDVGMDFAPFLAPWISWLTPSRRRTGLKIINYVGYSSQ